MAEPQPADVQEGAEQPESLPANAEDRKAAKAMSKLDTRGDEEPAQPKKEVDLKALNDAMRNLGVDQEKEKSSISTAAAAAATVKKEDAPKPLVKVDQADVALLVEQLDLSKTKATDLLRAHEADAVKAMSAWITATV